MLRGGCYCGAIKYEIAGPTFHQTNCHCTICRRTTGGTYVSWFSASKADFRWLSGTPTRFQSTPHGTRSFCPRCGAQLVFEDSRFPDELDVTSVSLEDPEAVAPRDHTQTRTRLGFVKLDDGLPAYTDARDP